MTERAHLEAIQCQLNDATSFDDVIPAKIRGYAEFRVGAIVECPADGNIELKAHWHAARKMKEGQYGLEYLKYEGVIASHSLPENLRAAWYQFQAQFDAWLQITIPKEPPPLTGHDRLAV